MNSFARIALGSIALVAALSLQACATGHARKGEDEEGTETKIKFAEAPAAVQAGLTREAGGVAIADVDKESDEGKDIYEADAMISGKNYEIKVATDGSLVSKKLDAEESSAKAGEKDEKDEKKD